MPQHIFEALNYHELSSGTTYYVTVTAYDSTYSSGNDNSSTIINENQTAGNESWYAEEKTVVSN